jgi:hypothetical protein
MIHAVHGLIFTIEIEIVYWTITGNSICHYCFKSLIDISRQSRKTLHTQQITTMISATSPHFTPPS